MDGPRLLLLIESDALLFDLASLAHCLLQGLLQQQLPAAAVEQLLLPGVPLEKAAVSCAFSVIEQQQKQQEGAPKTAATRRKRVVKLLDFLQGKIARLADPESAAVADAAAAAVVSIGAEAAAASSLAASFCCCWTKDPLKTAAVAHPRSSISPCCNLRKASGNSSSIGSSNTNDSNSNGLGVVDADVDVAPAAAATGATTDTAETTAPAGTETAGAATEATGEGFRLLLQRILACTKPHVGALRQLRRLCSGDIAVVCCSSNGHLLQQVLPQQVLPQQVLLDRNTHPTASAPTPSSAAAPEVNATVEAAPAATAAAAPLLRSCHLLHLSSNSPADFGAAVERVAAALAGPPDSTATAARPCCCNGSCCSCGCLQQQDKQHTQIPIVVAASTAPFASLAAAAGDAP